MARSSRRGEIPSFLVSRENSENSCNKQSSPSIDPPNIVDESSDRVAPFSRLDPSNFSESIPSDARSLDNLLEEK